jgi:hypothetical protein
VPTIDSRLCVIALCAALVAGCGGGAGTTGGGGGGGGGGNGGGGNNSTTVTVTFTGPAPTALATQVGSVSFTPVTAPSNTITLSVPSGTTSFGVAFECPLITVTGTQLSEMYVFKATTLDGTSYSQSCPEVVIPASSGFLTGSVDASAIPVVSSSGPGPFLDVDAWGGGAVESAVWFGPAFDFSFTAPSGSDRVEVAEYNSFLTSVVAVGEGISLAAARNFSNQTVPGLLNGGNTVVLGPADETTPESITYANVPAGFSTPFTAANLNMAGNGSFAVDTAATTQYPALPAGAMEGGDYYSFLSSANNPTASLNADGYIVAGVIASQYSTTAVPLSVGFPPPWFYAGPMAAALPTFDYVYSGFSGATSVYDSVILTWKPDTLDQDSLQVIATANSSAGSPSLAIPDLSALPGFLGPPASGTKVLWEAEISQGTFPPLEPMPTNGTVLSVSNAGWLTVP